MKYVGSGVTSDELPLGCTSVRGRSVSLRRVRGPTHTVPPTSSSRLRLKLSRRSTLGTIERKLVAFSLFFYSS